MDTALKVGRLGLKLSFVLSLWPLSGLAVDLFSPGELARAHANLEGVSNCGKCHPDGEQLSQELCVACHTELRPSVNAGKGFHGRMPPSERDCWECHHDHQGRDFEMVDWGKPGKKGFDHRKSGWPLHGKHAKVECDKCHDKRLIKDVPILAMLQKQPRRATYLGLPTECSACHFDEHRGQTEGGCDSCHTEEEWKKAPKFNHDKTDYPLRGKHRSVKCEACHPKETDDKTPKDSFPPPVGETFLKFAPIPHKNCATCHDDPHEGRFGPRCESCHVVAGWKVIRKLDEERKFHEKTRYPLRGEHTTVDCRACHGPFPGQKAVYKNMAFANCTDCHFDGHLGQLPKPSPKAKGPRCEDCHSVEGFMPASYTLDRHQKSQYPLNGSHQIVSCLGCHPRVPSLAARLPVALKRELSREKRPELLSLAVFDFPRKTDRCDACHRDVHAGQFAPAKPCAACHKETAFTDLTFDHQKDSRFPLTGKHFQAACGSCHTPARSKGPVRYKPLDLECASCHADVHVGQFEPAPGKPTDCAKCHDNKAFKPAPKFDHQKDSRYPLDGQHTQLTCEKCHRPVTVAPNVTAARYRPLPMVCEACHADYHQGAFQGFEP